MTEPEKPLHARVAEALGCNTIPLEDDPNDPMWWCDCVDECPAAGYITGGRVHRYDTDWSATGPLIEKYLIHLDGHRSACSEPWSARCPIDWDIFGYGNTHLVAVCNLILALKAAGKLA